MSGLQGAARLGDTMSIADELWFQDLATGTSCWDVQQRLYDRVRALPEAERMTGTLRLFADVMALVLDPKGRNPLRPRVVGLQRGIEELVAAELDAIAEAATHLAEHPDVHARLLDVLWTRRRQKDIGHATLRAYARAAEQLARVDDPGETPASRLERAQHIARTMQWREGWAELRECYVALFALETTWKFGGLALARLAPAFDVSLAADVGAHVATVATKALATAEGSGDAHTVDWDWAREALAVAIDCLRAAKKKDECHVLRRLRAESYVTHSDWLATRGGSLLLQADLLGRGVRAMRELGFDAAAVDMVHARMREKQREAVAEMKPMSTVSYDVTESATHAIEQVTGRSFDDALKQLTQLWRPTPIASLRKSAQKNARTFIAQYLIPRVHIDDDGRRVATTSVVRSDEGEEALLPAMRDHALFSQQYAVNACILPAIQTIALEHPATLDDWLRFLAERALVEPSRASSLAHGLSAGLQLNLLVAVPVLVPQVEYLIRKMVESRMVTSTLRPDGVQHEIVLGTLLASPEFAQVVGEDWAFDLRVLLTDPSGRNLRNAVAHGLLHDGEISSNVGLYLWFTALRLLSLIGIVPKTARNVHEAPDIENDDDETILGNSDEEE